MITRNVLFEGASGILEGVLQLPEHLPRAIAVLAHPLPTMGGTMDNKVVTTVAKTLVALGYSTLRFNYRGVGGSEGHYDNGPGEIQDAISAVKFLRLEFPDLPLMLAGFSFGGYVQACAAIEVQPEQLMLIAPAVSRFSMPAVQSNTFLVHGDVDEVIALSDLLDWARPQQLAVLLLSGASHYFHGRLTQLRDVIAQRYRMLAF
jgi:alpha/beta superfamily hydrolase